MASSIRTSVSQRPMNASAIGTSDTSVFKETQSVQHLGVCFTFQLLLGTTRMLVSFPTSKSQVPGESKLPTWQHDLPPLSWYHEEMQHGTRNVIDIDNYPISSTHFAFKFGRSINLSLIDGESSSPSSPIPGLVVKFCLLFLETTGSKAMKQDLNVAKNHQLPSIAFSTMLVSHTHSAFQSYKEIYKRTQNHCIHTENKSQEPL